MILYAPVLLYRVQIVSGRNNIWIRNRVYVRSGNRDLLLYQLGPLGGNLRLSPFGVP